MPWASFGGLCERRKTIGNLYSSNRQISETGSLAMVAIGHGLTKRESAGVWGFQGYCPPNGSTGQPPVIVQRTCRSTTFSDKGISRPSLWVS